MNDNSCMLRLHDGRSLAYMENGPPGGYPILLFHGTPGSRIWFAGEDETALSLGCRLIAFDRPGYGRSDPKPGRTVLDWADDIIEAAALLGFDEYSVLGVSGGGAYAAACAYKAPPGLRAAAMAASVAPFRSGRPPASMVKANRLAFILSRYAPWLVKWSLNAQIKLMDEQPEKFKHLLKTGNKHLSEWDRAHLQTEEQLEGTLRHLREAYRQGPHEGISEPVLLSRHWGFELSGLKVPVWVFHGAEDRMAPCAEMLEAAKQIPDCRVTIVPGAGHFLTEDTKTWRAILAALRP
ncbi:alpha/beta fold hydrolase [Paenibacillus tarimensis]|uniref:alpha/beta fold hydrolase n=1 Tax=Paenibacillus tarimensis TaxID=416012 RepID=UPI001F39BE7D|nr:alpha/beta hydrolase [Paenibacillus tarimensis]MCF2945261.1 alpha/beta hydrolase [Paenibacillus tarimensis]